MILLPWNQIHKSKHIASLDYMFRVRPRIRIRIHMYRAHVRLSKAFNRVVYASSLHSHFSMPPNGGYFFSFFFPFFPPVFKPPLTPPAPLPTVLLIQSQSHGTSRFTLPLPLTLTSLSAVLVEVRTAAGSTICVR